MNKLELLYKMMGQMKDKKECKGTVKVQVIENGQEVISTQGIIEKNHETHDVKGSVSGFLVEDGQKIELNESVEIKDLKAKKKAAMENCKCEFKGKMSKRECKISKMMFMLKVLNDIELTQEGEFNVLGLDVKSCKKIQEKIQKMMSGDHAEHVAKKVEFMQSLGMSEEVIKLKMKVMMTLLSQVDNTKVKIYVNAENNVTKVMIDSITEAKQAKIEITL